MPLRVIRALWRTVAAERSSEPVPWLYVASAAVGAAAAAVTRSRRRALGVATGAAGGVAVCWAVFASTAMRRPQLAHRLSMAVLWEVDPMRASRQVRDHHDAQARSVTFPIYGLSSRWTGSRWLDGAGSSESLGAAPVVTSLSLSHGAVRDLEEPWVRVTTTPERHWEGEDQLAAELWHSTWVGPDATASDQELRRSLAARALARRKRPPAQWQDQWQDRVLSIEGRPVPARRLAHGEPGPDQQWVAHAAVEGGRVVVRAKGVPLQDVELVRVMVQDYPSHR